MRISEIRSGNYTFALYSLLALLAIYSLLALLNNSFTFLYYFIDWIALGCLFESWLDISLLFENWRRFTYLYSVFIILVLLLVLTLFEVVWTKHVFCRSFHGSVLAIWAEREGGRRRTYSLCIIIFSTWLKTRLFYSRNNLRLISQWLNTQKLTC